MLAATLLSRNSHALLVGMRNWNGTAPLKNSSVVYYKAKHTLAIRLSNSICENKCPNKDLCVNSYSRLIINSLKREITQMFTNLWMDELCTGHPYSGILLSNQKKTKQNKTQNTDTCKNMDIFQMHYAKWKKPDSKGYILYEYIYMIFWKQSDRK